MSFCFTTLLFSLSHNLQFYLGSEKFEISDVKFLLFRILTPNRDTMGNQNPNMVPHNGGSY